MDDAEVTVIAAKHALDAEDRAPGVWPPSKRLRSAPEEHACRDLEATEQDGCAKARFHAEDVGRGAAYSPDRLEGTVSLDAEAVGGASASSSSGSESDQPSSSDDPDTPVSARRGLTARLRRAGGVLVRRARQAPEQQEELIARVLAAGDHGFPLRLREGSRGVLVTAEQARELIRQIRLYLVEGGTFPARTAGADLSRQPDTLHILRFVRALKHKLLKAHPDRLGKLCAKLREASLRGTGFSATKFMLTLDDVEDIIQECVPGASNRRRGPEKHGARPGPFPNKTMKPGPSCMRSRATKVSGAGAAAGAATTLSSGARASADGGGISCTSGDATVPRLRFAGEDQEQEQLLTEVSIASYKALGTTAWFCRPGAIAQCDDCDSVVATAAGVLHGGRDGLLFTRCTFSCNECLLKSGAITEINGIGVHLLHCILCRRKLLEGEAKYWMNPDEKQCEAYCIECWESY